MTQRRQFLPQRSRIFVGCEGESEQSYAKFLYQIVKQVGAHVHLDAQILSGGDPLSRVKVAIKKIETGTRLGGSYKAKFLFLDFDQYDLKPENTREAKAQCIKNHIQIIWQKPDHEGFLAQHFIAPGSNASKLEQEWPAYRKATDARNYAKVITLEHVQRAAYHNTDFARFLAHLKLDT